MAQSLHIVGATKAATTSLHYYLGQHPDIYIAPVKEPHYFTAEISSDPQYAPFIRRIIDENKYCKLLERAGTQSIIGEASASYLWSESAARRIALAHPDAKIIIVLREPVSRAYSEYLNAVREGMERRLFLQAVCEDHEAKSKIWGPSFLYVEKRFYPDDIARYLSSFGAQNVLVLFSEEFVADTRSARREIFGFLGIDEGLASHVKLEPKNLFSVPRNSLCRFLLGSSAARRLAQRLIPSCIRRTL